MRRKKLEISENIDQVPNPSSAFDHGGLGSFSQYEGSGLPDY